MLKVLKDLDSYQANASAQTEAQVTYGKESEQKKMFT